MVLIGINLSLWLRYCISGSRYGIQADISKARSISLQRYISYAFVLGRYLSMFIGFHTNMIIAQLLLLYTTVF